MNVRHNALRMIGLAGKTVIIDEVHAYDAYMSTKFNMHSHGFHLWERQSYSYQPPYLLAGEGN